MDFLNPMEMLPEIKKTKSQSRTTITKKRKKRLMAKASRRMNRYQTKGGLIKAKRSKRQKVFK